MAVSADSVLSDLKQQKYKPVYFLQGDEVYFIDLIAGYIENNVLTEADKGFNQTVVYGRDVQVNNILTHARRFPMMSDKQVVIVKEAQQISDLNREGGQKLLLDYIANPVPSTILVFCHKNKTLDKRKALGKNIGKSAGVVVVTSKKLYDNQVPDWVSNYIKGKGYRVTPKATQMLADSIGTDLGRMTNEIDKMLINCTAQSQITENEVNKYVGISKDYNVFELQKALVVKDVLKANRIINYFEANSKKNPIIPIIAMLFSFYSKLLVAHHVKDKSERGLASALRVNPFFVKDYITAIRNYSLVKVINNIGYIKHADLQSKGVNNVSLNEGQILKELIFKLMH